MASVAVLLEFRTFRLQNRPKLSQKLATELFSKDFYARQHGT